MAIDNTDDELDDLVRAAMKTLDAQVPSGYFEGLPNRTLARLEDSSMQTTSGISGTDKTLAASGIGTDKSLTADAAKTPAPKAEREEDSGLHDIRNLAASSRSRLSSRRLGTNPPPVDEDILASTSGSWKSIALPEPAKMVSLPEIAELPSKADLKAQQKAAKAEAKARKSRPSGEMVAPSVDEVAPAASASLPAIAKPVEAEAPAIAVEAPMIGARISGMKPAKVTPIGDAPKKKKTALLASLGVGVAAAAGVVLYISMDKKSADTASAPAIMEKGEGMKSGAAAPAPTVQAIATDEAKDSDTKAAEQPDDKGLDKAAEPAPEPPPEPAPVRVKKQQVPVKGKKPTKPEVRKIEVNEPAQKPAPKTETKTPPKEPAKEGDPDFDALLKESGYQKKVEKPKLDKKKLTASDFRKGMGAVQGKAKACYNGTEGTAMVKIHIAPSGAVTSVTVSGQFANTPVAACIIGAVKSAVFPPWDGPPASFNYSYLLAN